MSHKYMGKKNWNIYLYTKRICSNNNNSSACNNKNFHQIKSKCVIL